MRLLVLAATLAAGTNVCRAQFTIRQSVDIAPPEAEVSMNAPSRELRNVYFDPAVERLRRRRIRNERNTVEFNASLETALQQFENWTGSGSNNFYALGNLFFRHQYKKEKLFVDYRVDATYGMNFIDDAFFKNKDEFKINAQMGWTMHRSWSYSASVNIRSQFTESYLSRTDHTVVSRFMSPGYFDLAVGFTYYRQGSPFKATISPFGGNIVTVVDGDLSRQGAYGVTPGDKVLGQIGFSSELFFDKAFGRTKWLNYRTSIYGFVPYDDFSDPTFRWENTVELRITRLISTKLYGQMYYRRGDSPHMQFQYSMMIGLKYTFKNK